MYWGLSGRISESTSYRAIITGPDGQKEGMGISRKKRAIQWPILTKITADYPHAERQEA